MRGGLVAPTEAELDCFREDADGVFECRFCGSDWGGEGIYWTGFHEPWHQEWCVHGSGDFGPTWTCPTCGRVCLSEQELKAHALALHTVRAPGDLPCPSTGEAHHVLATPCEWVWHNRCEACGDRWDTKRKIWEQDR
jgi:hypothetical protein